MLIPSKHSGYQTGGRRIYPLDAVVDILGGGDAPPPPDYGPIAQASERSAQIMADLGREQLDFARQQYAEMSPLARRIAESQVGTQEALTRMAEEDRARYLATFAPVEEGLVRRAQEFDTEAFRERAAQQAAADAARAFGSTQAQTARGLARMGVAPGSGAAMAQMNQNAIAAAGQRAGAMTGARTQAEQLGYARMLDAAGLGRNLPGLSQSAYGASVGAGSAGINTAMAPGNQFMQGMGSGASTIGAGQQMQLGGLSNILQSQTGLFNAGQQMRGEIIGSILGAGAAMYGKSDRRLKQDIELVGRDERTGLSLYEFAYKSDPSRRFLGVMADEVEAYMPEAVGESEDGYKFVNYGMLGIEMLEVQS